MSHLSAFIGHSFTKDDSILVRKFTDFFDSLRDLDFGFDWTHAEFAEPKELSQKVREKIANRNLFIGLCTRKELVFEPKTAKSIPGLNWFLLTSKPIWKTSDWIIQEIGLACGLGMNVIILLEDNVRKPGGLQGDIEYIPFTRKKPEESFNKILQMVKALIDEPSVLLPGQEPTNESLSGEPAPTSSPPVTEIDKTNLLDSISNAIKENDSAKEEELSSKYLELTSENKDYELAALKARRLYFHHYWHKVENFSKLEKLAEENPKHDFVHFVLAVLYSDYQDYEILHEAMKYQRSTRATRRQNYSGWQLQPNDIRELKMLSGKFLSIQYRKRLKLTKIKRRYSRSLQRFTMIERTGSYSLPFQRHRFFFTLMIMRLVSN